ncbi:hypothetical protein LTR37_002618 [Vermiconidia calcicola]|uniref:Uncharacterized protein n=1 Tax=Vermiconidia calcicola TaxID=1690605 RepID=A0ACC3NS80_9PEZI|nr:hypothetical protein LTR37_002618 [Vermiconidia calcicola]
MATNNSELVTVSRWELNRILESNIHAQREISFILQRHDHRDFSSTPLQSILKIANADLETSRKRFGNLLHGVGHAGTKIEPGVATQQVFGTAEL